MVVWIKQSGLFIYSAFTLYSIAETILCRVWCQETGGTLAVLNDHQDLLTKVHVHKSETLFTLGLDNIIQCYDIKYPDITQDFDANIEITSKNFCR